MFKETVSNLNPLSEKNQRRRHLGKIVSERIEKDNATKESIEQFNNDLSSSIIHHYSVEGWIPTDAKRHEDAKVLDGIENHIEEHLDNLINAYNKIGIVPMEALKKIILKQASLMEQDFRLKGGNVDENKKGKILSYVEKVLHKANNLLAIKKWGETA
jgi:hypothetical protein